MKNNNIKIQYYKTKIGELILGSFEGNLCILDFRHSKKRTTIDKRIKTGLKANFLEEEDAILAETKKTSCGISGWK